MMKLTQIGTKHNLNQTEVEHTARSASAYNSTGASQAPSRDEFLVSYYTNC